MADDKLNTDNKAPETAAPGRVILLPRSRSTTPVLHQHDLVRGRGTGVRFRGGVGAGRRKNRENSAHSGGCLGGSGARWHLKVVVLY